MFRQGILNLEGSSVRNWKLAFRALILGLVDIIHNTRSWVSGRYTYTYLFLAYLSRK